MRLPQVIAVLTVALLALTGCDHNVTGAARRAPDLPGTSITADGFGIVAGLPDAAAQIELYTEPQCSHCADLQASAGPEMRGLMALGMLTVTYRPVTFLDQDSHYSAKVANALFLAAGHGTSAPAFQSYVSDLWGHQNPGGPAPSDGQLGDWAAESGVSDAAVATIRSGQQALDTDAMSSANEDRLQQVRQGDAATPTVYDLNTNEVIDTQEDGWLARLISGRMTA